MTIKNNILIDNADKTIIQILSNNARISMRDLAQKCNLSAPSITERVRRLQDNGIIKSFTIDLDIKALGYQFEAIVRIRPLPGQLNKISDIIQQIPECIECDKVTGDDCYVARFVMFSIGNLDEMLAPLSNFSSTSTAIIKGTTIARRAPPIHPDYSR